MQGKDGKNEICTEVRCDGPVISGSDILIIRRNSSNNANVSLKLYSVAIAHARIYLSYIV